MKESGFVRQKIFLKFKKSIFAIVLFFCAFFYAGCPQIKFYGKNENSISITNVSYDATREFYNQYNEMFSEYWEEKYGQKIKIIQSHGGSGMQSMSVLEGNEADVVSLAVESDIERLSKAGLANKNWKTNFPNDSSPYTSTIVFLVRKGNPKRIKDWSDIIKNGIEIITPNPKSSGGARWNFLAAWAFAQEKYNGDEEKSIVFLKNLYSNVKVLNSGARSALTTFVEQGQGDVLIAWENEAFFILKERSEEFEMVVPSISIIARPCVAEVTAYSQKHDTRKAAKEYLEYLYSDEAQRIMAENYFRPSNAEILKEYEYVFNLDIKLVEASKFGNWDEINKKFFADGAIFDNFYN